MKFSKELMKGVSELIVLKALQEGGESYGYQLIKTIREESKDAFKFQEGTLYPLLYRLEEKELVISREKQAPSGKIRRYYTITPKGGKLLRERTDELSFFLKAVKGMMGI